ncbi:MAG: hypothetical protein QNJ72_28200 [Pleurocapsa sp. MO_226.B13]|nr:hypothetical protein [Pleurocapsa sp. MO_226.B13]
MPGETNLNTLLQSMQPIHCQGEYVFCTVGDRDRRYSHRV